jgi:thiol-disulfide isomerase/thioredoxin
MDTHPPFQQPAPPERPRTGLAVASLVIGILAVFSSILVIGAFAGLLAILLGVIHIVKRRGPNGMAWTGIALSLLSIVLSVGLGALYIKGFQASGLAPLWHKSAGNGGAASGESESEFVDWIGEKLPEFTVISLDGTRFNSRDLRGRRVVLDFWATWCPPCKREIPHFVQLSEEHSRDQLLIIGISSEDEETLTAFVEENGVNYPIVSTDALPPPFDAILSIPTTFFIDRDGLIQNVLVGYHDYNHLKRFALAEERVVEGDETTTDEP